MWVTGSSMPSVDKIALAGTYSRKALSLELLQNRRFHQSGMLEEKFFKLPDEEYLRAQIAEYRRRSKELLDEVKTNP
jgi:hypothetical protein